MAITEDSIRYEAQGQSKRYSAKRLLFLEPRMIVRTYVHTFTCGYTRGSSGDPWSSDKVSEGSVARAASKVKMLHAVVRETS